MLVENAPRDAPWDVVARTVFWNRDVSLVAWRKGVLEGHRAYLPDSVKRMSTWNFVRFLGRKDFIEHWPRIRESSDRDSGDVARLDVGWSYASTGAYNMPPEAMRIELRGRSREVLDAVVRNQGASIYQVSKLANVPYRRAHAHVDTLMKLGLVRKRLDNSGPRSIARLYTMRSAVKSNT